MSIKQHDTWLEISGPVAVVVQEELEPVLGQGSVFFPPTFAPAEGSKETPEYVIDQTNTGQVALVDTIGSQANRMEPLFKTPPYSELGSTSTHHNRRARNRFARRRAPGCRCSRTFLRQAGTTARSIFGDQRKARCHFTRKNGSDLYRLRRLGLTRHSAQTSTDRRLNDSRLRSREADPFCAVLYVNRQGGARGTRI